MFHLIIFGPPGVGKGTQAASISEKLNLQHISTGEILRKAVTDGTEFGLKAKEIMDRGNLVPDEIMNGIVKETLENVKGNGFILDGFPRTLNQAKALTEIFENLNFNEVKVITLTADDEEITQRLLKRGRSDDNRDTILNRLKIYYNSTSPVKEYYEKLGLNIDINGVGEADKIKEVIFNKLI
ncbi:MAG: adenylate kinase [Ignavibacteria bacterium]|nr:adenylate kinase [Ignavibacteria bacterium]